MLCRIHRIPHFASGETQGPVRVEIHYNQAAVGGLTHQGPVGRHVARELVLRQADPLQRPIGLGLSAYAQRQERQEQEEQEK